MTDENIKKDNSPKYDEQDKNLDTKVAPTSKLPNQLNNNESTINKKVLLIIASIFTGIAIILFILAFAFSISVVVDNTEGLDKLGLVLATIMVMAVVYLPGLVVNIVAITLSALSLKTTIPKQKTWAKALVWTSCILLVLYVSYVGVLFILA